MCTWCIRGKYKSGDGCDYAEQNGYFDKHGNRVDDPAQDQCSGMLNTGCFPASAKQSDPVWRLSGNLITEEIMMRKTFRQLFLHTQNVNTHASAAG